MKIYPSERTIKDKETIEPRDIPLSYIDTEEIERDIHFSTPLKEKRKTPVEPTESFKDPDVLLFTPDGARVPAGDILEEYEGQYYYIPSEIFSPEVFAVNIFAQKDQAFRSDRVYNFRVSCIDQDEESRLSKALALITGSAPGRDCPWNIWVNSKKQGYTHFSDGPVKENDFLFVEADEGSTVEYYSEQVGQDELLKEAAEHCVNLWLNVNESDEALKAGGPGFKLKKTCLYDTPEYSLEYGYAFDLDRVKEHFPEEQYEYIELFEDDTPIVLLQNGKKNYIIISAQPLFTGPGQPVFTNKDIIYEVLTAVYLRSFIRHEESVWITDEPVDRIAFRQEPYRLNHKHITLEDVARDSGQNIKKSELSFAEVIPESDSVSFEGESESGYLKFKKTDPGGDPGKEEGQTSVFAVYRGQERVIYFREGQVNKLEEPLNLDIQEENGAVRIQAQPFKSTFYGLDLQKEQTITLENPAGDFYLTKASTSELEIKSEQQKPQDILATINIKKRQQTKNRDIRVPGGGLLETEEPDYRLFDIGHPYGRPYRTGATLIVRLPGKLEPYRNKIEKELDKYKAAGDYIILLFE